MKICIALLILFAVACSAPRTLYISNRTGEGVTLQVEAEDMTGSSTQTAFGDSLHNRSIAPGHVILNFGAGRWQAADKAHLRIVLSKTKVVMGDKTMTLPSTTLKHYGWFVNELVFRIKKPEIKKRIK